MGNCGGATSFFGGVRAYENRPYRRGRPQLPQFGAYETVGLAQGQGRHGGEEEGVLIGRRATFEEASMELPVAFVRHKCRERDWG